MTSKGLLKAGMCLAAMAAGAVTLYADTAALPVMTAAACADGTCVPRRMTNGYYQTKWRRWPVQPAPADKPGVREGIAAPKIELPEPDEESAIPPGAFGPPSPSDQQPGGAGAPPRSTLPAAPPPNGAAPGARPSTDLPPELRGAPLPRMPERFPGYPLYTPPSPRTRAFAAAVHEPRDVTEIRRDPAHREHGEDPRNNGSAPPNVLPAPAPSARPMPPAPAPGGEAYSQVQTNPPAPFDNRLVPSPVDDDRRLAFPADLNRPAWVGVRRSPEAVIRASANAEFSEPNSAVAAVLSVRSDRQTATIGANVSNPLRGTSRIALDLDSSAAQETTPDRTSGFGRRESAALLQIPSNPLR